MGGARFPAGLLLLVAHISCSSPSSGQSEDVTPRGHGDQTTGEVDDRTTGEVDGEGQEPVCVAGERRCGEEGGVEACTDDGAGFVLAEECVDLNPCTLDGCAEGLCTFEVGVVCDDSDPCTRDLCMPFSGDCAHGPDPDALNCCSADGECDDGRAGTADLCDLASGMCINQAEAVQVEFLFAFGAKGTGEGELTSPKDIHVMSDDRILVADSGNNRVLMLEATTSTMAVLSEASGKALKAPGCVYEAPDGRIFVCDTGNDRILVLDQEGNVQDEWPPADSGAEVFLSPTDVTVHEDGTVFVADGPGKEFDSGNRIIRLNAKGQVTKMQGKTGEADGNFDRPAGLGLAADGNLYIADQANNRVQILSTALEFQARFGEEGGDPGMLKGPSDLALTDDGRVLVADNGNQRIQVFEVCMPDCTGKLCGSDGCTGTCGECPSFCECNSEGMCDGWIGDGEEGCVPQEAGGCGGCPPENCVCTGEGALDPSLFYEGADSDPYCCETQWDPVCIYEAQVVCGYQCPIPEDYEWPELEPTFAPIGQWQEADTGNLTSPLKLSLGRDGLVYVLDTVKARVLIYRLILPPPGG